MLCSTELKTGPVGEMVVVRVELLINLEMEGVAEKAPVLDAVRDPLYDVEALVVHVPVDVVVTVVVKEAAIVTDAAGLADWLRDGGGLIERDIVSDVVCVTVAAVVVVSVVVAEVEAEIALVTLALFDVDSLAVAVVDIDGEVGRVIEVESETDHVADREGLTALTNSLCVVLTEPDAELEFGIEAAAVTVTVPEQVAEVLLEGDP